MAITTYTPDFQSVSGGNSAYFDGSASSTNKAIISSISANFDAEIYIERSNNGGTSWTQVTVLEDGSGSTTFNSDWHSQGNRIIVESGVRRVRVDNIGSSGELEAIGDEL